MDRIENILLDNMTVLESTEKNDKGEIIAMQGIANWRYNTAESKTHHIAYTYKNNKVELTTPNEAYTKPQDLFEIDSLELLIYAKAEIMTRCYNRLAKRYLEKGCE